MISYFQIQRHLTYTKSECCILSVIIFLTVDKTGTVNVLHFMKGQYTLTATPFQFGKQL